MRHSDEKKVTETRKTRELPVAVPVAMAVPVPA